MWEEGGEGVGCESLEGGREAKKLRVLIVKRNYDKQMSQHLQWMYAFHYIF